MKRAGVMMALAAMTAVQAQAADIPPPPDPATVTLPELTFTATPEIEDSFDKYFYFNRANTSFAEAWNELMDCDLLASGLSSGVGYQPVYYPYAGTMAGALGGAIGNVMAAAIFGSAEKRRVRRVNMRRCMHYKGYQRYGLEKELWQKFNFEEGFSTTDAPERTAKLAQQAKVASGPKPTAQELGL
jgi:hypothetical protein